MQDGLFMVVIEREIQSTSGTTDTRCIGFGSDSNEYSLVRLEDGALLPATEWVCHTLCQAIGIATPDFRAVQRKFGDVAFASRIDTNVQSPLKPQVKDAPPINIQVATCFGSTVSHHSRIYGLDAAVGNPTRNIRKMLFRSSALGSIPVANDFSNGWVAHEEPFGAQPWEPLSTSQSMMDHLHKLGLFDADEARETIARLCALPDSTLQDALNSCHPSWVQGHDWSETLAIWADRQTLLKPQALKNFSSLI